MLNERSGNYPDRPRHLAAALTAEQTAQLDHLLKVASSVAQDANQTWANVWAELKICVGPNGAVAPQALSGFVPACGWKEFLEKMWLLKHYLDSIHRICNQPR